VTLPAAATAAAFVILFSNPAMSLAREWLGDSGDSGYGLLLFPVALWLAWRDGIHADATPNPRAGTFLLIGAALLRALGSLAAELYSQRLAIWLAIFGLVVFTCGWRQIRHWWLPLTLLVLSIPLPAVITNYLTIPLQFQASALGAGMIRWRHIPVVASGNVIDIPGQRLFVAEACSGLRSLTALLALGVMIGGMYLTTIPSRILLLLFAIPVAVLVNGVRIFLTAFLMYFVDPSLGRGLQHERVGWALFLVSFAILGGIGAVVRIGERRVLRLAGRDA
jgi:exosortase